MAHRLGRNLTLLFLGEGTAKALAMVVFFFLGKSLGPASYGDLEFAVGVWFVLNLILESGLAQFGAREASRARSRIPALIGQITILRVGVLLLDIALLTAFIAYIDRSAEAESLVYMFGLVLLPSTFLLGWVFQARDEMGVVAASNLLRQTILAAGVFVAVRGPLDVAYVPIFDACGVLAVVMVQWVLLRLRGGSVQWPTRGEELASIARSATPMALSALVWALRLFLPLLALHAWAGSAATGYFGAGHRMVVAAHTFVWLYFFNLLPALSRLGREADPGRWEQLLSGSMALVCRCLIPLNIALALLAPTLLVTFYGSEFAEGSESFSIAILLLGTSAISGHFRYGLIARDRQNAEFLSNAVGLMVVGGILLLSRDDLSITGAAIAFLAGEGTALLISALCLLPRERSRSWAGHEIPWVLAAVILGVALHQFLGNRPFIAAAVCLLMALIPLIRSDSPLRRGGFLSSISDFGVMNEVPPEETSDEPD